MKHVSFHKINNDDSNNESSDDDENCSNKIEPRDNTEKYTISSDGLTNASYHDNGSKHDGFGETDNNFDDMEIESNTDSNVINLGLIMD